MRGYGLPAIVIVPGAGEGILDDCVRITLI